MPLVNNSSWTYIIKVYIAEDDAFMREMLTKHLPDYCSGVEIVGSNGNGQVALSECIELIPDLIILDISLPELGGLEILCLVKAKFPQIRILIYSGLADQQSVEYTKCGKADGYIMKNDGLEEIAKAIKAIEAGGTYFSCEIVS